jgi:hypothetical protein
LIRIATPGPEVSLKGSPTVSPMTAALWASELLLVARETTALLDVLLGVVPGAARVRHEERHRGADCQRAGEHVPASAAGAEQVADARPAPKIGDAAPGSTIWRSAAFVAMSTIALRALRLGLAFAQTGDGR